MSIKSLVGLSIWNPTSPSRSSSTSISRRGSSQNETPPLAFGLPSPEDPDPFGVRALELAGLEIKEAGSSIKPGIDAFDYRPSPTSPAFRLSTQSLDLVATGESEIASRRNSKRNSKRSLFSLKTDPSASEVRTSISEGRNSPSESAEQSISESRNFASSSSTPPILPPALPPRGLTSLSLVPSSTIATFAIDAGIVQSPTIIETNVSRSLSLSNQIQLPATINESAEEDSEEGEDDDDDDDDYEGDIVIEEVSTSTVPIMPTILATPIAVKAKVVSIRRRGPPALPMKSPLRSRFPESLGQDDHLESQDGISSTCSLSPDKSAFDKSESSPVPWSEQTSLQDNESIRNKDIGRDSLSISDPDDRSKSLSSKEEAFEDAKETTPIAMSSDSTLPFCASKAIEDQITVDTAIGSAEVTDLTPVVSERLEPDNLPDCEHKNSISGSTVTSITNNVPIVKSSSEQSLADLIKQGLSASLANDQEEDQDSNAISNYYYEAEEPSSDYEDDAPVSPTSFIEPTYSTPGAFESEPLH